MKKKSNIILIGMPGAGKSTVGVILAKMSSRDFIDTDVLIQTAEGRSLQNIVDHDGHMALRRIEEKILLRLSCNNHVIATGGSAIYSTAAMDHLKTNSIAVFLDIDLASLKARIRNFNTRGLAKQQDQTLEDLFRERFALYKQHADVTIDCRGLTQEEVCEQIITKIRKS